MDSSSLSSIQTLVRIIKVEIFSKLDNDHDLYSLISPSAYETAWLAMLPHPHDSTRPLFEGCLEWVLNNQNELGFWGETYSNGDGGPTPTIDSLSSTLACLVVLRLRYMHANAEMLVQVDYQHLPKWFTVVFPGMVDLAKSTTTLDLHFPPELETIISSISFNRQQILQMEEIVDMYQYPPLLSYVEALPATYEIDEQAILKHLSEDGSLFQSPSATAHAFMLTGNEKCMDYLVALVQKCPRGVPPMYPMDEEMIKLCIVNQIQRLGLAEHFKEEIEEILIKGYRNYKDQESQCDEINFAPTKIYKDSLAFRLQRTHGYNITPGRFCWFLQNEEIMVNIEQSYEHFISLMYNVYRATDVLFPGENELEEARSISKKLLEKAQILRSNGANNFFMSPVIPRVIEHELSGPWIARLDHLDHRLWIEENKFNPLCIGIGSKASFYRWSKEWGLSDMGFGREKTTYCYFAVTTSCSQLSRDSAVRLIIAKSAIIIVVADDFYDIKQASLDELHALTNAILKHNPLSLSLQFLWDDKGLSGPSKTIFKALDNLVSEIAANYLRQEGINIREIIQDIWCDTFASWMVESTWSISGYVPSIDEYLETGMTSIAAQTLVLPCLGLLSQNLTNDKQLKPPHLDVITKLLMVMTRMLNDIQTYEREENDGKMNLVSLLKEINPKADIVNSVTALEDIILDGLRKEFLKHVFMDDLNDMPKDCKLLHLSCLKAFQMLYNSKNRFDSNTELLHDIKKAIYLPLENRISRPIRKHAPVIHSKVKESLSVSSCFDQITFKCCAARNFTRQHFPRKMSRDGCRKVFMAPKISICFI
ncbi:hypothetical protein LguiB_034101 [Lonicera macranthoides]